MTQIPRRPATATHSDNNARAPFLFSFFAKSAAFNFWSGDLRFSNRSFSLQKQHTHKTQNRKEQKQKHTKGLTQEQIYKNDYDKVIKLEPKDEALFLLQRIRDEAHRFAISYQKVRRKKSLVKTKIDQIPTIGPKKRKLLFDHCGSYRNLKLAKRGDLEKIKGLSKTNIDYILDCIQEAKKD